MKSALVIALATGIGCGSSGSSPDAAVVTDGKCGADLSFTGEVVNWDSTDTNFCGVFGATLTVHGDPARTDKTNPNGRFELCVARAPTVRLDLVPPAGPSMCSAAGVYPFSGIVIADRQVIDSGAMVSARMIGMQRAGTLFDSAKASVFVHTEGSVGPVTSSAPHGPAMAWDGSNWQPGDSGSNVVFPNTDVGDGTTTVGVASGSAIGTGTVPVAAGTFTCVTIVGK